MPKLPHEWTKRFERASISPSDIHRDLRFEYPWNDLEAMIQRSRHQKLNLVGYGSLLNPTSAARTITDTPADGHPPVLAFGARRVFNYVISDTFMNRYQATEQSAFPKKQRAALNTTWTGSTDDLLNARLIPFALNDLDGLREREKGYDLEPVAVVPWDNPVADPLVGFVLCATERPWNGRVFVSSSIEPYPPYLETCREGARIAGKDFEDCFLDTCWLADGVTPLREWLT